MGLGGGGDKLRWAYLMDCVDVASLVNEMAVQTMMLNADRLTKNFYSYFRPDTGQWSRIPWDLESAFGISRGLGGEPARLAFGGSGLAGGSGLGLQRVLGLFDQGVKSHLVLNRDIREDFAIQQCQ